MLPVFFVHRGNQNYLKNTIKLAEKNNVVILLGDETNKHFCKSWISIDALENADVLKMKDIFINLSPNNRIFELDCILRYFYIYEYMKRMQIKECFHCDSDVCIYYNLEELDFSNCDVALNKGYDIDSEFLESAHCSYWTIEALESFIEFVKCQYSNHREQLWDYYKICVKECFGQGISDMALLMLWENSVKYNCKQLSRIFDNKIIDHNINIKEVFDYDERLNIKKIIFKKNIPFLIKQDELIQAIALHFQGGGKKYILMFSKCINSTFLQKCVDLLRKLKLPI